MSLHHLFNKPPLRGSAICPEQALPLTPTAPAGPRGAWLQHFAGKCNYGSWCGADCTGKQGEPIDTLDEHCKEHDYCLVMERDPCLRCRCHGRLIQDIWNVRGRGTGDRARVNASGGLNACHLHVCLLLMRYNATPVFLPAFPVQMLREKGCALESDTWAGDACQSIEAVKEAPTIAAGIGWQMGDDGCNAYTWDEGCPSQAASTDYSEEVVYTYDVTLKTSCDSGSGTNGAVKIKLEHSRWALAFCRNIGVFSFPHRVTIHLAC